MSDDELFRAIRRVLSRHTHSRWVTVRWWIALVIEWGLMRPDRLDIHTIGYLRYPARRSTADPEGDLAREILAELRWSG